MRRLLPILLRALALLLTLALTPAWAQEALPTEAQRALDRAGRLLRRDRAEEAALVLAPLARGAPGPAADQAQLELGQALVALGLPHLALLVWEPLALRPGPAGDQALERLLDQAQALDDQPLVRELAVLVPMERWPGVHREPLHLARGYALMQQGEWSLAQLHFEAVHTPGLRRAQADFFTGVVVARKDRLMAAVRHFRQVDLGTRGLELPPEEQAPLERLKDLALVNIGHVYFGLGRYDGALGYYSEPGEQSEAREAARLGLAWARFLLYDLPGARRAIKATRSVPTPRQTAAQAEADLLEALVSFQGCDGAAASRELRAFELRWGAQHRAVAALLPLDALQVWEAFFPAQGLRPLEGPLRQDVLNDADLARVHHNLALLEQELLRSAALSRRWQEQLGPWAEQGLRGEAVRYRQVGGDLVRRGLQRAATRLRDLGHEGSWTLVAMQDAVWEERCANARTRPVLSTLLDPP